MTAHLGAKLTRVAVKCAAGLTVGILALLLGFILVKGVPELNAGLFALKYTSDNCSMLPAIVNTLTVTVCALLLAVPLGVGSAIYLCEYARRGDRLVKVIRMTAETLSGILTVTIMVLPTVMRTTEEALLSVPDLYREGSFGLGAGRLRTVFRVVLPSAMPGIAAGVVLSTGRIVGETAALIFTSGTASGVAGLTSSGRTLAVHMYALWNEGLHMGAAYATGVVLLVLVVGINALSGALAKKYTVGK